MLHVDSNLKAELSPYLDVQERLIWAGKPLGGFQLQFFDIFLIPFSLVWCGFSIFWVTMAAQVSVLFALFGLPFVLVGLYLVIGRFIVDKQKRESTVYGLTENRILIKSGKRKIEVQSFHISSLPDIDLVESQGGLGTISFGTKIPFMPKSVSNLSWPGMKGQAAFLQITEARRVFNEVMKVKKESQQTEKR